MKIQATGRDQVVALPYSRKLISSISNILMPMPAIKSLGVSGDLGEAPVDVIMNSRVSTTIVLRNRSLITVKFSL